MCQGRLTRLRESLEYKFCCDAEVLTGTEQCPEEVFIFGLAGTLDFAAGQYDCRADYIVNDKTSLTRQMAITTTKGQAADTRVSNRTANGCETVFPCCCIDVQPKTATLSI